MRPSLRLLAGVLTAMALAGPAPAATLFGATSFHVFGDSLGDTGRAYRRSLGFAPQSPPYFDGRFSDGRVYSERVAAPFIEAGLPSAIHAFGGANAITDRDFAPDMQAQAQRYRDMPSKRKGKAALGIIHIGGNDLNAKLGSGDIERVGRRAANATTDSAAWLAQRGVTRILIANQTDLGAIPRNRGSKRRAAAGTAGALAYNARLESNVAALRAKGADVRVFDAFGLFRAIVGDPARYGLSNVTTPCLRGGSRCSKAEARRTMFFDDTHPTTVTHAIFAGAILAALDAAWGPRPARSLAASAIPAGVSAAPAPVPLPAPAALLLAGLAALGVAARQRRGRRA